MEQACDQLSELRDVLEQLFKAAIAGVDLRADQVNRLLSKCKSEIDELETAFKQENGRKRIKGSPSSLDLDLTLTTLAANTSALRGIIDTYRR